MALVIGTNSYVDIAYADTYFTNRYGASETWSALDEASKESALLSAMPLLEGYCTWSGEKTDDEQALSFPRDGNTEVPISIQNGQCELAFSIVESGSPVASTSPALKRLKADTVELEYADSSTVTSSLYNSMVTGYLNPYCNAGTQYGSGSKPVIRV